MRWCVYWVTLFFCGFGDTQLEIQRSSSHNIYQQLFIKTVNESARRISKSLQERSRNTFIETDDFGLALMAGKHCLSNIDECINRDVTHQASASHIINYLMTKAPPLNMDGLEGVSVECQKSHQIFMKDLHSFKYWALQMYDATAKLPSGFLNGNIVQFGDFDLCMKSKNVAHNIYGQYCLANIQVEVPSSPYLAALYNLVHSHALLRSKLTDSSHRIPRFSSIQWAICVPHTCSPEDVDIAVKYELKHIFNGTEVQYNTLINSDLCSSAKPEVWPTTTILGWIVFLSVILVELFATLYDTYKKENKNELVLAFSIRHNFERLCSLKTNDDIDAIHFIRFINGLILMAAHKSMALLFLPYVNRTTAAEELGAAWTVVGRAASLYTDPFIMISGTLTSYSLIGKLKESKPIYILKEYMSRILRILPTFSFLIMFCTLILPWTNAGPLWKSVVTHHSDICKNNWWKNVLFIHNYFGFENMCLTHTHHIGIDTQLFFISPFLILLLWRWPKRGSIILTLIAGISTWMRYYSTYKRNLANYVYYGASTEQLFRTADYMYIIPVYRLTVYIMGIILGYLLRQHKDVNFKQVQIHIGNFFAVLCFIGAFLAPSFMGHIDYAYNPVDAAWYAAYAPILWCLCFAWIIYITHIGYSGYMAPILRNPIPRFWSKISYTVYLTQFPIYFYNVGTTKHSDEFGVVRKHLNFLEFFWILCSSVVLTLIIEIPSQNIKEYIFRKPRQLQDHTKNKKKS